MRGVPVALLAVMCLAVLAGCTAKSNSNGGAPPPADFSDLSLAPTATTGIIRGVVVDNAIRPLLNATVTLKADKPQIITTKADGAFGFDGLAPGTYFLAIHKRGFLDVQSSADVVAGVQSPPIVRIQLAPDGKPAPFYNVYTIEGIIECGTSYIAACGAGHDAVQILCTTPPSPCPPQPTNDAYSAFLNLDGGSPDYVQSEMVWDSTQSLGNNMYYALRYTDQATYNQGMYTGEFNNVEGPSPLLDNLTGDQAQKAKLGNGTGLVFSIFSGDATNGQVPVPLVGGPGATVEQRYTFYVHTFYGYLPPATWRFSADGPPPPPQ